MLKHAEGGDQPRNTAMTMTMEDALSKEVPTHLFQFQEKIFGMTIQQLMIDTVAGAGIWYLWNLPLSLSWRIGLCGGSVLLILLLVHVHIKGRSVVEWLTLSFFFWLTPPKSVWYTAASARGLEAKKQKKPSFPSVQALWVRLLAIEQDYMVFADARPSQDKEPVPSRYSVVLEVTGINIELLSLQEQVRIFQTYETFLAGLEFPLQIVSSNEAIDIDAYEPLLAHEERLALLQGTPRLAALAQSHAQFLRKKLGKSVITRHFVIVSATPIEESLRRPDGKKRTGFSVLSVLLPTTGKKTTKQVTPEAVLQQLHIRLDVVSEGLRAMGLQTQQLDNAALAQFYASTLAPGSGQGRGEHISEAGLPLVIAPSRSERQYTAIT